MAKKQPNRAETPSLFDSQNPDMASTIESPGLPGNLPDSWKNALAGETRQPYWAELMRFVASERATNQVFPPEADVFNAFRFTPLERVEILLLGQDPYPTPGVAHGLCFSVLPGIKLPASLRNIYRELEEDVGAKPVEHGYLATWAQRGILMLNACLTVRANQPNSHAGKGWEKFTDAAIRAVNTLQRPVVFLLWGGYAKKKEKLIDSSRHTVITGTHPSPLSANSGFFGSKPFSKINEARARSGLQPFDWQLPEVAGA